MPPLWNLIALSFGIITISLILKNSNFGQNKSIENIIPAQKNIILSSSPLDNNKRTNIFYRLHRALAPIAAGLLIDMVDLSTFGQIGIFLGFSLGAIAGLWMGYSLELKKKFICLLSLAAGIYCMIPGTEYIPLGTIVGAILRFWETGNNKEKSQNN